MLKAMKTLIDGKNEWTIKQDTKNGRWVLYKNEKKLKSSVNYETVCKLMPDYKDVYGR